MQKLKGNSFKEICDKLEEDYIEVDYIEENEITYVRTYLKKYENDRDKILKIKAEAEDTDYNIILSLIFSMLAMFFAAISVIILFQPEMEGIGNSIIKIVFLISILIVLFLAIRTFTKFDTVKKWRKYVLVVANEFINEFDKPGKGKKRKKQGK